MTDLNKPRQNHLLDALPNEEYERLLPYLELVPMELGKVLHESGAQAGYAYFPTTCLISLYYNLENGASSEVALVGNEGMVGIALFMDGGIMLNRAAVVSAGYAYRLQGQQFARESKQNLPLLKLLLRYTQALITQLAQTAVCNRHHTIDQQLCRFILLSLDRLAGSDLMMTQELIASMLGVRRESVSEAIGKLQRAGLVAYHRGRLTVLNRPGLEARVCECYQVVKTEFDRLLPMTPRQEPSTSHNRALSSIENHEMNLSPLPSKAAK
jgi:CRP-like cAMP-binding protein